MTPERLQMLGEMVGGLGLRVTIVGDLETFGLGAGQAELISATEEDFACVQEYGYTQACTNRLIPWGRTDEDRQHTREEIAGYPDLYELFSDLPENKALGAWALAVAAKYDEVSTRGRGTENKTGHKEDLLITRLTDLAIEAPEHAFAINEVLSCSANITERLLAAILLQTLAPSIGDRLLPMWHGLMRDKDGDVVQQAFESLLANADRAVSIGGCVGVR